MTRSEENYLKAIYHLSGMEENAVATNEIAKKIETKPSSVTDMIKKLSEKGLVAYTKYKGVSLSKKGSQMALSVIRKHRLWESFLVDKLDFMWDEVHEIAEQLEHIKSEKLINRLDAFLGFPKQDPHGDPIPSKNGEMQKEHKKLLADVPIATKGICVGVKNSSAPFLRFMDKNSMALGDTITVLEKEEFDGSFHIQIRNNQFRISNEIAANLYIQPNE